MIAPAFLIAKESFCKSNDLTEPFDDAVELISGGGTSETETDGSYACLGHHAHGRQHRRQFDPSGMTC